MAETILLNDGSMEYVFGDKAEFLQKLLDEKLGSDAAQCFTDCINEVQSELNDYKSEFARLERLLDGYMQALHIIKDAVESYKNHFENAPRLKRAELREFIHEITVEIDNYI